MQSWAKIILQEVSSYLISSYTTQRRQQRQLSTGQTVTQEWWQGLEWLILRAGVNICTTKIDLTEVSWRGEHVECCSTDQGRGEEMAKRANEKAHPTVGIGLSEVGHCHGLSNKLRPFKAMCPICYPTVRVLSLTFLEEHNITNFTKPWISHGISFYKLS